MNETTRKEIDMKMSTMDMLMLMSEGNPGALNVLAQIVRGDPNGFITILNLDDMNIRGTQIWVGFKDYCGSDMEKFKTLVTARDPKMIAHINREGVRGNHTAKAVKCGASSPNGRKQLNA
jgi:hypothetical protein